MTPEPRRRGHASLLGTDAIVSSALEICAESHLDAVTLREVARRLHTGQSSLYVWVPNRRALLRLMLARVLGTVRLPRPDAASWQRQLIALVDRVRIALDRYPGLAAVMIGAVPTDPAGLRIADTCLALMRLGGVPDVRAAYTVDLLNLFVAAVSYEHSLPAAGGGVDPAAEPDRADGTSLSRYFADLDPQSYPEVTRLARVLGRGSPRTRFLAGVEVIVAGLTSLPGHEQPGR